MPGHLEDRRSRNQLMLLCFLLYLVLGLARYNYGACIPAILAVEPLDKAQAGLVSTVSFFAFAAGTALGGVIADRIHPRWVILSALVLSGLSNLVFFSTSSYAVMVAIWCLNGLAQGPVFCSIMRLINGYFRPEDRTAASIDIQCAFFLGIFAAYALSAVIIGLSGWRVVFLVSGLAALLFAVWWHFSLRRADAHCAPAAENAPVSAPAQKLQAPPSYRLLGQAGLLLVPLALMIQGVLRDGVSTWGPTYVGESFGLDASLAIASNTVIPLVSVAGVFAGNWVKLHLRRNELLTATVFFALSSVSLALLLLTAGINLALTLALLCLSTAAMSATNAMLVNAVPLQFGAFGRSGAMSGILNTAVYAGSGASTYGIGVVVTAFGWGTANLCWLVLAVLAALLCLLAVRPWSRFKRAHDLL